MVKDKFKDRKSEPKRGEAGSVAAGCTVTPIARHRLQARSGSLESRLLKDGARLRDLVSVGFRKGRKESGSGFFLFSS